MVDFFSTNASLSLDEFKKLVLEDYKTMVRSRAVSLLARREVLQGYASFGVSGDGKELPQVVMARYFKKGDFLSGYYRDQTFCFSKDLISMEHYFAQLYADVEPGNEPCSGGRQMNAHFATAFLDEDGQWLDLTSRYNIPANVSQTAGQMPRAVGFAYVSKLFRNKSLKLPKASKKISKAGDEVCFCTVGDGSTAEGHFLETVYAAAALQIPLAIFIWDDGYGISVPSGEHMAKGSISDALYGLTKRQEEDKKYVDIYTVEGWDYAALHQVVGAGIEKVRSTHIPAVFHIKELTQPLGHSSSGSHERYKTKERLAWEAAYDCNVKMREWLLAHKLATEEELKRIEQNAEQEASKKRDIAWAKYLAPIQRQTQQAIDVLQEVKKNTVPPQVLQRVDATLQAWEKKPPVHRHQVLASLRACSLGLQKADLTNDDLARLVETLSQDAKHKFNGHLYTSVRSAAEVEFVPPTYDENAMVTNGYKVINEYFDKLLEANPLVLAFGEDVGEIGDVNQGFSNLQSKHGKYRVFDTGIRELTIVGQAMGMAMRGLRPIAEIQYLDYLLYGLQPLSDDVATLHYRTAGKQSCPMIIRTRGHRLEGIWHSGSPMAMMASTLKGVMIGVPRNMVQAAAMYNSLMASDDPGIIVEPLNGYRLKETLPNNLDRIQLPFGWCEVVREGTDVTVVSYGVTLRIVMDACAYLHQEFGISAEVIDIQTLLPFDTQNRILQSLQKTNRVLFVDEDLDGGFAAMMLAEVIDKRGGFYHLDAKPRVLSAPANRTSFGRDGEYFSKPSFDDIVEAVDALVRE